MRLTFPLLLIFLLISNVSFANNLNGSLEPLVKEIHTKKLWQHTEWINLLHYDHNSNEQYLSQVDDKRFFNAESGKNDPEQELIETLRALYKSDSKSPDTHAQCRFIARFEWLKKQLPGMNEKNLPDIQCNEYQEWRKKIPSHKVTLIFPAYHLNSPSSMFGHTLLRLDPEDIKAKSSWLSMAVNFGANIQASDNSMLFAIKGLAGGYSGTFAVTPYYNKIKEYNRDENRDIWEYPLNLSPQETEKIVLHLWELKDINFDYYFFDENCSYRLLELLEIARPKLKLTDSYDLTAIPVDTVRTISNANLISDIQYRPSQATNINYLLSKLNNVEKELVLKIAKDASLVEDNDFLKQHPEKVNIILDTAYRYLRYQQNDNGRTDQNAKNSFLLLKKINKQTNFESYEAGFTEQQKPETGHFSRRINISLGEDDNETYAEFEFRMSFHSLEDQINGFLEGAQINIGSLSARAYEDELQLQQLNLIDIFSLTPRNDFFQPLSWRVYTGLEQQHINGKDHLTGHVTGGAGVTYQPWSHGYFYSLFTARLEANSQFTRTIEPALGLSSGLLHHFSFGTAHLELSGEEFLNDQYRHRVRYKQNIPLIKNHALEFSVLRQRQNQTTFTEAQLSYHYFFQ